MNGITLDIDLIYDSIDQYLLDHNYDVRSVGYDPYNAKEFIDRWSTENGPYAIEKVIQGAKTETVPLGELKTFGKSHVII